MHAMKRMNNDMAVSPIVATLVLIVVAVIGAVAVGTIMGTFSGSVGKQVNANGAASASATGGELLIAGSTTIYPASVNIAKDYMTQYPATKITVQQGGSGAGWTSTLNGIVDIGAMSEDYKQNTAKYVVPAGATVNQYKIGGSGIIIITNSGTMANTTGSTVTKNDLYQVYNTVAPATAPANLAGLKEVVTRADASGTADTFYTKWLNFTAQQTPAALSGTYTVYQGTGNEGVVAEVAKTPGALGFADMGYVFQSDGVTPVANVAIVPISDNGFSGVVTKAQMKTACKDFLTNGKLSTGDYPLVRGLYYITLGDPSPVAAKYIQFAQSPGAQADFAAAGMFSNADLS